MKIEQSGVRFANTTGCHFLPTDTLKPLRDHIVVEITRWNPSRTLEVVSAQKPYRGIVRAVGKGHYPKRYNHDRSKMWESESFRPTTLKVGDVVELGGLELGGYQFPTCIWDNRECVMCREADVCVVYEQSP